MAQAPTQQKPGPDNDEPKTGPELIQAAAKGDLKTQDEANDALDWFLSDDPGESEELTSTIQINVGGPNTEHFIPWEIRAIDLDTLRRIRRTVTGTRAQRRSGGELDEVQANLAIVVEGTVNPNLVEAAKRLGIASPATALKTRFRHKPGLIGQIAGEILSLSGYDEEDVREVAAAKNS